MKENEPRFQPTGLRNLRAYQLAKELSHLIYDLTANFPKGEYRLVGQMRGAAVSTFGNIAEGFGRNALGITYDFVKSHEDHCKNWAPIWNFVTNGIFLSQKTKRPFSINTIIPGTLWVP